MQVTNEFQAPATLLVGKKLYARTEEESVWAQKWALRRDTPLATVWKRNMIRLSSKL